MYKVEVLGREVTHGVSCADAMAGEASGYSQRLAKKVRYRVNEQSKSTTPEGNGSKWNSRTLYVPNV